MSEAQLYWAWDRKQPYNQDGSKRYVEMVDAGEYEALRDENTRLTKALRYALADLKAHVPGATHTIAMCEAALTPQAGKGGGNG